MNPDAHRQAMDRTQMPYMNGIKTSEIATYLDDFSHKQKQLPIHQQTNKPFLRHKTTETKTVLFGHGDVLANKPDFSDFSRNANNGVYYTGSVRVISGDKESSVPLTTQQTRINQQNSQQHLFTLNPYIRSVSASDVAAGVNSNGHKLSLSATLAVSSLPEMSSVPPQPPSLQRNSFLRPLSETPPSNEIRQASSNVGNSATFINSESNDPFSPQRYNRKDSDSSLKSLPSKFVAKQGSLQNAASNTIIERPINSGSLSSKRSFVSHPISLKENRPFSQGSVKIDGKVHCPVKSNVEHKDYIMKPYCSQYDISSLSNGAFPCISLEPNTSTALSTCPTGTDHEQSLAQKPALNMTGDPEKMSLKKMLVSNTLTGLVYYRRHSEPRASSMLASGNKNSSNMASQYLHEPMTESGISAPPAPGQRSVLPSFNPPFDDKSNASAHSHIKPSTQETKIYLTSQTVPRKVHTSEQRMKSKMFSKPPLNANIVKGTTQTPISASQQTKKTRSQTAKLLADNHSQSVVRTKETSASRSKVRSPSEQRSIGDGAPSDAKRLLEMSQTRLDKDSATDKTECDEEEIDDEVSDDAFSGNLEQDESKDQHRKYEAYSKGERLPGDGEANYEVTDENEELESIEFNNEDGAIFDRPPKISIFGQYERPVTADSAQVHLLENSILDGCLKPAIRPVTAMGSDVLKPAFRYSLFHKIPPTINFVLDGEKIEQLPLEISRLLKWKMSPITPLVVKAALARVGFKITRRNHDWLGCFGKHMKSHCFKSLHEYQKLNHFPGSFQIGRKDKLWRTLSKMQIHFGKQEFNFFPQTFVLPNDLKMLKQNWEDGSSKQKWIIKPPASARGIGIRVINKWSEIPKHRPVIVQKYIHRPFLINESKFDMRIYVYVSCYDPLRLYVYEDGLARFASCRYSSSSKTLSNKFMHLTNYSINKNNSDYLNNTDSAVCQGHKWSLKALWNYMKKQGINTNLIWETIRDLIIKTIISGEPVISSMTKANSCSRYCCHELFGFDILLDENFKPWILEVNISPSLHSNSQLDLSIKGAMIKDMMNIAGFRLPDERDIGSSRSGSDSGFRSPINTFSMDKRLLTNQLAADERAKHAFYCQRYSDELTNLTILGGTRELWACELLNTAYLKIHLQALSSILNILTPDDIRLLCESIDEDNRKGNFQRLFPTPTTHRYLRYFEQSRYYNLLLDQWVLHYNHKEHNGIKLLQTLCAKNLHLQNPTTDIQHQWSLPKPSFAAIKSSEARNHGHHKSSRDSGHLPLLRNLKTHPLKSGQLSQSSSRSSVNSRAPSPLLLPALFGNSMTSSNHLLQREDQIDLR